MLLVCLDDNDDDYYNPIWLSMYLSNPAPFQQAGYDIRSIFKWSKAGFQLRVLLLLDWLPYQGKRTQSTLIFTHSWERTDGLSEKRNTNNLIQDLTLDHQFHFLRQNGYAKRASSTC